MSQPPAPPTTPPPTSSPPTASATPPTSTCPTCGEPVSGTSNFCEACGHALSDVPAPAPVAAAPVARTDEAAPFDLGSGPISAVTRSGLRLSGNSADDVAAPVRPCLQCGGVVDADGYCGTCGAKALSERDHFREQPAPWVAGVCDKGIVHHRNEDAMAMTASPDGTAPDRRAVLVVLDGVSNTDDSSAGSIAGARGCLPLLATPLPQGMGTAASRQAAIAQTFAATVAAANEQVVAATTPGTAKPASATFSAVVLEGSTLWFANIGDSRSYWLPDDGGIDGAGGVQLSVDDSAAQAMMEGGMSRAEAETSPQAHAITRWLGDDAPDLVPTVGSLEVTVPGWVVNCSDGLWNYASEPAQLAAQVAAAGTHDPAALALTLVEWANAQGGRDNITACVARVEPRSGSTERAG